MTPDAMPSTLLQKLPRIPNLRKDGTAAWRGTAIKDGQQVQVWLDYKGNVGQQ